MTSAIAIKMPEIPARIEIGGDWLDRRDELLLTSKQFVTIPNNETLQTASEVLGQITKHSNALEKKRTELSGPFTDAAKAIKLASDKVRDPLEIEKTRLKNLCGVYAENERRKAADEAARIEREQREAIERQVVENEKADEFGLVPSAVVVAPIVPAVVAPKVHGASIVERIEFEIVNVDDVPRAFCMVDERLINEYKRQNSDTIKSHVRAGNATGLIPGVKFKIETSVQSR